MVQKAVAFLEDMGSKKVRCVIPSLVVAEFLVRLSAETRIRVLAEMQKNFHIAPFDLPAAVKYAELCDGGSTQADGNGNETREKMKVDRMIVALAEVSKADCLYSHDPHVMKVAKGRIDCREIPEIEQQLGLSLAESPEQPPPPEKT